jgi:hypothetical protein
VKRFVKRRAPPLPGSIPDVLGMFTAEVRFYREIAPQVGVRVPECYEASEGPEGYPGHHEDSSSARVTRAMSHVITGGVTALPARRTWSFLVSLDGM